MKTSSGYQVLRQRYHALNPELKSKFPEILMHDPDFNAVLQTRRDTHPLGCITSLQQGHSGRLSRRSSRSITSLQQGRSGRLGRKNHIGLPEGTPGGGPSEKMSTTHPVREIGFFLLSCELCIWTTRCTGYIPDACLFVSGLARNHVLLLCSKVALARLS